jgi:predicted membrane protein
MDQHEEQQIRPPRVRLHGDFRWGLVWGFVIVLVGLGLLLEHMDLLPPGYIFRFWPLVLVLLGLMNLVSQAGRVFGILLVGAGVLLELQSFGLVHFRFADVWPLAIIAVGVLVMWASLETRGVLRSKFKKKFKVDWTDPKAAEQFRRHIEETSADTESSFTAVAVFGGCERRYTGQHFQSGKATSIFGGIELDLRDADIDDEAVLEISAIFGGVELRVPETWQVTSRSLPVFGGFEDKTRQTRVEQAGSADGKRKTLVVTGVVVFGGVEIRN